MKEDYRVPSDLDGDIVGNTSKEYRGKNTKSFFGSSSKSHVLLSACREGEIAYERDGRGQFTRALLQTLRDTPTHKITYRELLKRITVQEYVAHYLVSLEASV